MWPLDGSFDSIWFRLLFHMVSFISLKDCSRMICASICVMEKCLFHGGSYWISGAVCHRGTNWPILSEFGNVIWISVTIRTSVMRDKLNGYWPPCVRESQNPQSHMLRNFPFCSSLTAFPVTLQMDLLQVLIRWPHWLRLPAVCHSSPVVLILHFCSSPRPPATVVSNVTQPLSSLSSLCEDVDGATENFLHELYLNFHLFLLITNKMASSVYKCFTVFLCVCACMCVFSWVSAGVCMPWYECGCQKTTLGVALTFHLVWKGFLAVYLCMQQVSWPWASRNSPVFAWQRAARAYYHAGLVVTQVPLLNQQILYPLRHMPKPYM